MATPTKSLKDPKFKYRNSAETDISVTFRRERKRLEALKAVEEVAPAPSYTARPLMFGRRVK